jgi:DNA-binding NarL/FixJ family response regulator
VRRAAGANALVSTTRSTTRNALQRAQLTTRQLEILELLSEGLPNAAIAQRLFLSTRTVEHYVSAILDKLGARSRTEASRLGAQLVAGSTSSQPGPNG